MPAARAADAPRRHVHHPDKRLVITRILQEPEPGHDVADLASLEELEAAHQLVGHAAAAQRHFERSRQGIGAKQNAEVSW
jgi:hypothetical protein